MGPRREARLTLSETPVRIAQFSDIHCGDPSFRSELMRAIVEEINRSQPDVAIVAGDLTAGGYHWEFDEAAEWLEQITVPKVIVPGNHDSKNVGYVHFPKHFGERFSRYRRAFDPERAERLGATGVTIVGADSSEPDLNDGQIGRERYSWIQEQFDEPDDIKIFVLHHHLVPVPGTGRERNIITDAGDVLAVLSKCDVDLILSGHKHVPFFWGLNGILLANSGTATTRRVRGLTPPSWNEIHIDASTMKVYLRYEGGKRELAVIFSRKTRAMTREAFYLTQEFLDSNHVIAY